MTIKETFLTFAFGVAAVVITHTLFIDVNAQGVANPDSLDVCVNSEGVMRVIGAEASCPAGERKFRLAQPDLERPCEKGRQADVEALQRRVSELEGRTDERLLDRTAIAPFNVVNEAGITVFSVGESNGDLPAVTKIFNETGVGVATILARTAGGEVSVFSTGGRTLDAGQKTPSGVEATLASWGEYLDFTVNVNSEKRLELGQRKNGRFGLSTYGASGKVVAGIGESEAGSGIATVFDADGNPRASVYVDPATGGGVVIVRNGTDTPVAALSGIGQGGSGLLQLTNNAGKPMVNAEVFPTGIGAVRAGPGAFQSGSMFIGLPASYIEGKKP